MTGPAPGHQHRRPAMQPGVDQSEDSGATVPGQHHSNVQVRISHVDNPYFTINTHAEDGQYTT